MEARSARIDCGGGQGAEGPSAKDVGLLVGRLLQGESFVGSWRFYPLYRQGWDLVSELQSRTLRNLLRGGFLDALPAMWPTGSF